jgi:putative restriction endonuclease
MAKNSEERVCFATLATQHPGGRGRQLRSASSFRIHPPFVGNKRFVPQRGSPRTHRLLGEAERGEQQAAHDRAFATQHKGNEIVVAFQPAFFVDYATGLTSLHQSLGAYGDLALLNQLDHVDDVALTQVRDETRRIVIQQIARRYRASRFRGIVLSAYGHRCAFCGIQLGLLDAAHILPVFSPGSSDEVTNGISLCKSHHYAYDSNLVTFDINFRLLVNERRMIQLSQRGEGGGGAEFCAALYQYLILPSDSRNNPGRFFIERAFQVRAWDF